MIGRIVGLFHIFHAINLQDRWGWGYFNMYFTLTAK